MFVTSGRVAQAASATLQTYLPGLLPVVQQDDGCQLGRGIVVPREYRVSAAPAERLASRALPLVGCWAHIATVEDAGRGKTGIFALSVSVMFRAADWDQVAREAGIWEIAVAACLDRWLAVDHRWIDAVTDFSTENGEIQSDQARTYGLVDVSCLVAVPDLWPDPDAWPIPLPPVATTVATVLTKENR